VIAVAQVVEDLKIGGLERVIENIALYLNPQLFKVYVLCLSKGGAIADRLIEKNKNVEILHISNYHNFLGLLKTVRWLKRKEIDIVHTHAYPAGVLGRLAAIIAQVPYIFHHQHSTYYDLNKRNYFIERFLSGFTHKVICCSEAVKRFVLEKEGISEDKVVVVYNGVPEPKPLNPSGITGLRKALGIRGENKIVSCVGSLTQHKGHEYLLHAFKEVKNAYLLLIGDGPLRKKLESKVYELGLSERVVFIGYKIDVIPYMQLTDLIVLPSSEREGLGMSLL
jgi:glycosyltransferase involved in cell wall biosynthesis